jgi:hypothetical protein
MSRIRPECLFPEATDPFVAADGLVAGDSEEEDDEEEEEGEEEDEEEEKEGYSE